MKHFALIIAALMGIFVLSMATNINRLLGQNTNRESGLSLVSGEFRPVINGALDNDVVSALQMTDGQIVFFNKVSGQAITKSSTNGVCFLKGKFYFAAAPQGGLQFADIFVSQAFGANELSLDNAVAFEKQRGDDFMVDLGPNVRHIDLQHILHKEIEMYPLAQGTPLHSAVLQVENERLVLLFESFSGIKGKAILDDQLNPISTALTEEKDSKKD